LAGDAADGRVGRRRLLTSSHLECQQSERELRFVTVFVDRVAVQYQAFARAYRRDGDADPAIYLAAVPASGRDRLGGLIDGYLRNLPRRVWDAPAFAECPAALRVARELAEDLRLTDGADDSDALR
jgi:hypothetical protein